jgi:hypothetical protein
MMVTTPVVQQEVLLSPLESATARAAEIEGPDWIIGKSLTSELAIYAMPDALLTAKMNARGLDVLEQERLQDRLDSYNARVALVMDSVSAHIGKTPYVYSGSSPRGWDCSGLTRWAYAKVGIDLYHRASVQLRSGKVVSDPVRGDLVVFGSGYHVGLYHSPGKMLHSGGRPGDRTEVRDITDYWGKVTYVRLIPIP